MPKAFLHTAATEIGAEKQEIISSCHIFLPFVLYQVYLSLILTSLCPKITQNLPQIIIVHVFVISRFSQKCVLCHFQACHYLPLVVQRIDFIHSFDVNCNIFPHFEHCDVVNAYDLWVYFYFLNINFIHYVYAWPIQLFEY